MPPIIPREGIRPAAAALPAAALLVLLAGAAARSAAAPQAPEPPRTPFVDRVEVNVVNVEVFVTDRRGRPVEGLRREDFELEVEGEPVAITNFYAETAKREPTAGSEPPAPGTAGGGETPARAAPAQPAERRLRLIVFVDQTALQPLGRKRSFKHLRRFLSQGLADDDEVTLVSLAPGLRFHGDFARDRDAIEAQLGELEKSPALDLGTAAERRRVLAEITNRTDGAASDEVLSQIRAISAIEYDLRRTGSRALAALIETLAGIPGRKAVFHISDGISIRPGEDLFIAWRNRFGDSSADYGSTVGSYDLAREFQNLADKALGSGVTFYALDADPPTFSYNRAAEFQGDASTLPSANTEVSNTYEENKRASLEIAVLETGGRRVVANGRLPHQLALIGGDFQSYYSLGFARPPGSSPKLHQVKVRVPGRKGLVVRHRTGFADRDADQEAAGRTLAALLFGVSEDPLGIRLLPGRRESREDGLAKLPLELEIPLRGLALLPEGDALVAALSLFVTLQDEVGGARPVQRIEVRLEVPAAAAEELESRSARYQLPLVVGPQDRRVALAVRDDVAGVIATSRLDLPPPEPSAQP